MRGAAVIAICALACGACAPLAPGAAPIGGRDAIRSSGRCPRAVPSLAPLGGTLPKQISFAPASEPAARYNDPPPPAPRTPLGDAVIAAVRDAARTAGVPTPVPDRRLFQACADLAQIVPEERGRARLDDTVVAFALQHAGIIEPEVRLLYGWGSVDEPERFVAQLRPRLAEIVRRGAARVGVGVARQGRDGLGAIVFAVQGTSLSTLPIQRTVAADGRTVIDAVVDPAFHRPEVLVTHADGATEQIALHDGRPNGFVAQIACGARPGREQIEIVASDASGQTVLANFPVWCGAAPPSSLTFAPLSDDDTGECPEQIEQVLLADVNRDRAAAGLPILLWDDIAAAVARSHSEDMRRTQIIAHVSPSTGSTMDRMRAARIHSRFVLENVARAHGIHEAHELLMNSPGHRANLLSPDATHIGIGVVLGQDLAGRRALFITQLITRELSWAETDRCDPDALAPLVPARSAPWQ